ncbi:hypothetical protein HHI36_007938 [Cryptolaemus montrouzieri]|uniref:Uncharacterized protein n=1 Tax=Cryptolaemus montrouzieri TaxID=559131 RepID=A0ABD2MRB0_9CUCU
MMTKESPTSPNNMTKTKAVAIVAPQRSNSLDYLNFHEKRELIASSLSISDFLNVGNNTAKELKEATSLIIGEKLIFLLYADRASDIEQNVFYEHLIYIIILYIFEYIPQKSHCSVK